MALDAMDGVAGWPWVSVETVKPLIDLLTYMSCGHERVTWLL